MPLRNFGLSLSRRGARANAGLEWHPRPTISLVVGLIAGAAYGVVGEVALLPFCYPISWYEPIRGGIDTRLSASFRAENADYFALAVIGQDGPSRTP
jgi:hypothetical protein